MKLLGLNIICHFLCYFLSSSICLLRLVKDVKPFNLWVLSYDILNQIYITNTHTQYVYVCVSVGICCGKCSFHPLCGLKTWRAVTLLWGRPPELSLCNTCSQHAEHVEMGLWGLGWTWATAGNQSHYGIGGTLLVWRLHPVKVSVPLMPDCNSSSYGPWRQQEMARLDSFLSQKMLLSGGILYFFLFCFCFVLM